uniref:Protein-S-isoprenylcysteine O-methyltransferase n=1 Tax=Rhizochromulina marina TaxID=1034831 RepID=A0A7S2SR19_9STRA|mmetsp:Transcript_4844/g.14451  ORF Transcript_4844/g.14451 Transcript_4844/m.14451 type:complete len:293 (+) Transcript_4844:94-972(+)
MVGLLLVNRIQSVLNFDGWESPQFKSSAGVGRIGVAGFGLGIIVGVHVCLLAVNPWIWRSWPLAQWGLYVTCIAVFHFTEFFTTAMFKPTVVSYDSFVINHSTAYTMAVIASAAEFWVEFLVFGHRKFQPVVFVLGLGLIAIGQFFRSAAMWTARESFNHLIVEHLAPEHRLITHGVYRIFRHPSYFGWFWWCVGTQVLLCNPIVALLYAGAAWNFFQTRVPYEEATLLRLFGEEYKLYAQRTPVAIPFVKPLVPVQRRGSAQRVEKPRGPEGAAEPRRAPDSDQGSSNKTD